MESILIKLINTNSFKLTINSLLPNFNEISVLLKNLDIPFEVWTPKNNNFGTDIIELTFGAGCDFKDVYLLIYLLKDYSIKLIYPTKSKTSNIKIGTYLHTSSDPARVSIVDPKNLESFLLLDPKLDTNTIVNQYFYKCIEYLEEDEEYYTYITNQPYISRLQHNTNNLNEDDDNDSTSNENYDYEKDTFNEMTDGNFGDYDDFDGDLSDINDSLGR
ncbi:MAG: hypothetical protein R2739_05645 [Chitinophagales bacterium]